MKLWTEGALAGPRSVARLLAVLALCCGASAALADKLTEENMTAKDFSEITETEESEAGKGQVQPPIAVHDFNADDVKAMKNAHATKLFKGKDWKNKSRKERDKALRGAYGTVGSNNAFVIEVPSGNVWVIPVSDYNNLNKSKNIRPWTAEEREKLPKAVKRDPGQTHSDRSGIRLEREILHDREP